MTEDNRNYGFGDDYALGEDPSPGDIHQVDEAIFGAVRGKGAQIVARPLSIVQIWPDMRQPRRAVPLKARGQWNGYPQDVPAVLAGWQELAENEAGSALDIQALLRTSGEGIEVDPEASPVVAEFLELVALAASIRHRGLTNPITVTKQGQRYVIETGERRWLAFHLLTLWTESDHGKIPAVVKDKADVWRQAEENAARRPLNAIGMARQFALLLMDQYPEEDFGQFDQIVLPGECDRKYYAQVANGQAWPVVRGMGQAVLNATGLKSKNQISQYRNLLSIPDEMWIQADMENWSEFRIRSALQALNTPTEPDDRLTTVNPQTGESGGNSGGLAGLVGNEFQPFQRAGGGNLGNLGNAPKADEAGLVPTESTYYPPTLSPAPSGGYEESQPEEMFSFGDTTVGEARQPVVADHPNAAAFLQLIGHMNEQTVRDPQVAAVVASLLQFSPFSIQQIFRSYGGQETYQAEIERSEAVLSQFVDRYIGALVELLSQLRSISEEDFDHA